ncbi:protein kinase domain-containing protein [Methanospirillum stamsii]|uniref:protein kinase domain-containing protein n=1 Tax=Methanospirillum stamsii TaxID=1277351 RepID=UPI0015E86408|nr:tetratricopeptide repeat protein [Methanospirillum stamsii]
MADLDIGIPGFGPSYVSDTIPDRVLPGHSYPVLVSFRNSGLVSWEDEMRRFGLLYEGDYSKITAIPSFVGLTKGMNITPGKVATFGFTLLPLGIPGTYDLKFSVVMRSGTGDQKVTETYVKRVVIVPTDGISSPVNGSVFVESPILDMKVSMGSQTIGNIPAIIADIKPGSYEIRVSNQSFDKTYPADVERGTMTRLFIRGDENPPVIEKKKAGPVSDGTLLGYIEANIPLILIILLIICACSGVAIHGLRKRRRLEEKQEKKEEKDNESEDRDSERLKQEKKLLEKVHSKKPLIEGISSTGTGGSGGMDSARMEDPGKSIKSGNVVRKDGTISHKKKASAQKSKDKSSSLPDIDIQVRDIEAKPGSAVASIGISNHSENGIRVEDMDIGAGGFGILPVELSEPTDDAPEVVLPLRILISGSEFLKNISIPYNRGVALLARGVVEKAYEYFRTLLQSDPDNVEANINQAQILLKWGLEEEAALLLEEILKSDPSNEEILEAIERIREANNRKKKKAEPEIVKKIPGYPDELLDRYTPIRVLGDDPFATVILVRRNDTGELRALKIPRTTETISSSLYTEISLLYQLKHPYVLRMFRAEFSPIVMLELEYVAGGFYDGKQRMNLFDLPVPLPEDIWFPLLEKISEGLLYLHKQGVRHYHLSPKHILLDEPMVPKISGLIRESLRGAGGSGKEEFFARAPEQIDPEFFGKPGKRTDIFLLGAIWFWFVSGKIINPEGVDVDSGDDKLRLSSIDMHYARYDYCFQKLVARYKRDRYSSVEIFLRDIREMNQLPHESDDLLISGDES